MLGCSATLSSNASRIVRGEDLLQDFAQIVATNYCSFAIGSHPFAEQDLLMRLLDQICQD